MQFLSRHHGGYYWTDSCGRHAYFLDIVRTSYIEAKARDSKKEKSDARQDQKVILRGSSRSRGPRAPASQRSLIRKMSVIK